MQKYFEKIKESLEEDRRFALYEMNEAGVGAGLERAIEIVNQVVGEYAKTQLTADNSTNNSICSSSEIPNKSDGWIPCSERLPEEEEVNVLVSSKAFGVSVGLYTKRYGYDMQEGFITNHAFVNTNNAVAWQPLPAPFKPKGEQP